MVRYRTVYKAPLTQDAVFQQNTIYWWLMLSLMMGNSILINYVFLFARRTDSWESGRAARIALLADVLATRFKSLQAKSSSTVSKRGINRCSADYILYKSLMLTESIFFWIRYIKQPREPVTCQ